MTIQVNLYIHKRTKIASDTKFSSKRLTFNSALSLAALIVCVYEEPVVPEQAATVTEKLGEYLISVGY